MRKVLVLVGVLFALLSAPAYAKEGMASVKVEAKAEVLTGFSDASFVFETRDIPTNITVYADENIETDDQTYKKGDVVDTGKSGAAFDLYPGKYKAAAHNSAYFKSSDAVAFTVTDEDKSVTITGSKVQKKDVSITNAKEGFSYEIKAAEDIKDYKGNVICPKDTVIGQSEGEDTIFIGLPIETTYNGKYVVSETKVPEGCFKADSVMIKGNSDSEIAFKEKMTITTFKLTDEAGKEITEDGFKLVVICKDEEKEVDGKTIKALTSGDVLTVESSKVPAGYLTFSKEFTVADDEKEQIVEIEVQKTKASFSVLDVDDAFVAGCTLVVMQDEKVIQTFTSGKSPKEIKGLAEGDYTLKMTNASRGYCVADSIPFSVSRTDLDIRMKAVRPKGYVLITLVSVVNRTPLSGAVFDFKDNFGQTICTVMTDKNGQAKTQKVEIGEYKDGVYTGRATYRLKERKSADGYVCDQTEYKLLFDYVDDQTPEVHIEAMLPNRAVVDEPVKTKLVARQVEKSTKDGAIKTGDRRMLLIIAAALVIIALLALTFIPDIIRKRKLKELQKMNESNRAVAKKGETHEM